MATITLSNTAYNEAKQYAQLHNISVDEFIVTLINRFAHNREDKKKFEVQPIEELAPELQEILNMPRSGNLENDDINGINARMEYYKEKYGL